MVKKLFKHEFLALIRLMLPVEIAVLGIGILTRVIMFFENDSIFFKISATSIWILMGLAVFAGSLGLLIFAIVRYYKNLFSGEGYLSFTLPVTPAQHLIVKSVTAVVIDIATFVIAIISLCIATSGNLLAEIIKAGVYLIKKAFTELNTAHLTAYIFEIIIALLLASFVRLFIYYTCITIGQTARKHRILTAVGVYFAYNAIIWVLTTVLQIVYFTLAISAPEFFEKIGQFVMKHPYGTIHIVFGVFTLISGIFLAVCFLISHTIIRKKLNLE